MNEQKKLRKQAIKKLMAEGCPEDLAKLMPKVSESGCFGVFYGYGNTSLGYWFNWFNTKQSDFFWGAIYRKEYGRAREILRKHGLKPWSKKVKTQTEFEMMSIQEQGSTLIESLAGDKHCQRTLINHFEGVPSAINEESKNG